MLVPFCCNANNSFQFENGLSTQERTLRGYLMDLHCISRFPLHVNLEVSMCFILHNAMPVPCGVAGSERVGLEGQLALRNDIWECLGYRGFRGVWYHCSILNLSPPCPHSSQRWEDFKLQSWGWCNHPLKKRETPDVKVPLYLQAMFFKRPLIAHLS